MACKKNIGCYAPLSIICPPYDPPNPPEPPGCELITNEFAGNFLITKEIPPPSENPTLILWEGDGVVKISGTISVYNSTSSTAGITVQIIGKVTNTFTVYPGNTMSYIGQSLQSVAIIDIPNNPTRYMEGKYCCQFSFCL
ncbi:group-specific protein [Bacillus cereus]|uniref:S-Ena type endospore appendage n=1 Tax=Bacillus cereus TaxID=1396 RepID=UPI000D65067B|nr:S-Ena type endospore appendage [Bacillus cereus]PWE71363.1 group-specific protein [Bacillus cereus]